MKVEDLVGPRALRRWERNFWDMSHLTKTWD